MKKTILGVAALAVSMVFGTAAANAAVVVTRTEPTVVVRPAPVVVRPAPVVVVKPVVRPRHVVVVERRPTVVVVNHHHRVY